MAHIGFILIGIGVAICGFFMGRIFERRRIERKMTTFISTGPVTESWKAD